MFKELGALAGLFKNMPKIQEEMARHQQTLGTLVAEGDAGAGMVRVKINGRLEMVALQIAPEALADRELLEDLICAASNQALSKARQLVADETRKMMGNLGLPVGMFPIPGLG